MNDQTEDFVGVYQAGDEASANIIKAVLEDEGISAIVRPMHTSWLDGAMVAAEGLWGEVMVQTVDAERAEAVLAEYGDV